MNLKEIYVDKKTLLDNCYMEYFNAVKADIEQDERFTLADDELDELILDLMLSNVLGKIVTFNEIDKLTK